MFAEIHKTPSIIYPSWNRESWSSAEDPSLPGVAPLIHWPAGTCLFPEATRWVLVFPGNVGERKGRVPKPLFHFIICFFPTWRPHHLQWPGAFSAGDLGSISGSGRSPGGGHSNLLQYSCLENPHRQRSLVGCSPWSHKE